MPLQNTAPAPAQAAPSSSPLLGASEARQEAARLAAQAGSLDELREAIAAFEGIALKRTATQMVFADGKPGAPVMVIGEAPGADEDRQGLPFMGMSGQLLDEILKCIGLSRHAEDPRKAVYISNILNWRPPGNRTPAPGEIEASLPFIERHIALAAPKALIFAGGVPAKALLSRTEGISRLRQTWHDYNCLTPEIAQGTQTIPALATYHPSYLLSTPGQKRAVWADMLMLSKKLS
jgi:DNA polymerase